MANEEYINGEQAIKEIEKSILLIKERTGADKKISEIKNTKLKDWVKYLLQSKRNIDLRSRINGYYRKDYVANYFRDKTVCILASLNE